MDENTQIEQSKQLSQNICDYLLTVIKPQRHYDTEREVVIAALFLKAFKHYQAVNVLCQNGFGQDAMIITRVIVELYIKMKYLFVDTKKAKAEKRPEKYLYYFGYEMWSAIDKWDRNSKLDNCHFTDKHRKQAENNYKQLKDLFDHDEQIKWREFMRNLKDISDNDDVKESNLYNTYYANVSHIVHSNSLCHNLYRYNGEIDYKSCGNYVLGSIAIATELFFNIAGYYHRQFGQIQSKPMIKFKNETIRIYGNIQQ